MQTFLWFKGPLWLLNKTVSVSWPQNVVGAINPSAPVTVVAYSNSIKHWIPSSNATAISPIISIDFAGLGSEDKLDAPIAIRFYVVDLVSGTAECQLLDRNRIVWLKDGCNTTMNASSPGEVLCLCRRTGTLALVEVPVADSTESLQAALYWIGVFSLISFFMTSCFICYSTRQVWGLSVFICPSPPEQEDLPNRKVWIAIGWYSAFMGMSITMFVVGEPWPLPTIVCKIFAFVFETCILGAASVRLTLPYH